MLTSKHLGFLVGALAGCPLFAQQAPPPPETKILTFEVATIKPTARTDGEWRLQATLDGYTGEDISLLVLVGEAYGDKFDLQAKFSRAETAEAKNLTFRQRADMLQPLLADRFALKVHTESREFPVYDLVIAKGGPRLQETKLDDAAHDVGGASCRVRGNRSGYIHIQGCMTKELADLLRFATGRTVIDKTALTTRYNFELRWTPDNTPIIATDSSSPSIFTALQEQLGLKLVPATGPLNVLVIDAAGKPSEN